MKERIQRLRPETIAILTCLAISLFCLFYPIYVIWPFRYQGVWELAAALIVLRFRNIVATVCAIGAILAGGALLEVTTASVAADRCRPGHGRSLRRAALSRVNVYELMFHPLGPPAFVTAAESQLDKDEKVIAIRVNGAARAYPIRGISYHHIVNDVVGGEPVVATY